MRLGTDGYPGGAPWLTSGPGFARAPGITLVALADTISTASAFAARTGQEIDGNGEMIGIGVADLAAGLFQGSRSAPAGRAPRSPNGLARIRAAQSPAHG